MGNLIVILTFLFISTQSFAGMKSISCQGDLYHPDTMVVSVDQARLYCTDGYFVAINGIGLGLRIATGKYQITCHGNTEENLSGLYLGNKTDVSLIAGVSGAYYFGRKGFCTLRAGHTGLGAAASVSSMYIYRK
jgi:hypothetical protein